MPVDFCRHIQGGSKNWDHIPMSMIISNVNRFKRIFSGRFFNKCVVKWTQKIFPSVLWRSWFGGRKGIQPVKNWVVGCWCGQWRRQGGSFPPWVDVQKLCNMCVLSLSLNFFVSHDKYIARPSSKEPRWYTDNTSGLGTSYSRPPIDPYLTGWIQRSWRIW